MTQWTVPDGERRIRLDIFLARQTGTARHQVQKLVKDGAVQVDGRLAKSVHEWLDAGQAVNLTPVAAAPRPPLPTIPVLLETGDFVVIDKPAGIAVHPAPGVSGPTIVDWALARYPQLPGIGEDQSRPGIVHRLDKPVSGCLVVALTQPMYQHLKRQFMARTVHKEYLGLVHGELEKSDGTINLPIGRTKEGYFAAHTAPRGVYPERSRGDREAITAWEVQARFHHATLLRLRPATGRTHQLRVHGKAIGHSIVGDTLYASRANGSHLPPLDRLFLHAARLSFTDLGGDEVTAESPLPPQLEAYLANLKPL